MRNLCPPLTICKKNVCSKIRKNILARAFRLSHHKQRSIQYKDFKFVYNMFLAEEEGALLQYISHLCIPSLSFTNWEKNRERKNEKKNTQCQYIFHFLPWKPTSNRQWIYRTHMTVFWHSLFGMTKKKENPAFMPTLWKIYRLREKKKRKDLQFSKYIYREYQRKSQRHLQFWNIVFACAFEHIFTYYTFLTSQNTFDQLEITFFNRAASISISAKAQFWMTYLHDSVLKTVKHNNNNNYSRNSIFCKHLLIFENSLNALCAVFIHKLSSIVWFKSENKSRKKKHECDSH